MCLWAHVGGWKTSVWRHTTVNHTTGVSCITASMTTFAFWVMTFTHSARAAFPELIRILAEEDTESPQHLCLIWWLTETVLIAALTSLLSTEASQLRPVTCGKPSLLLLLLLMVGMSLSKNGLSSVAGSYREMPLAPYIHKVPHTWQWRSVFLTSAAVALDI